MIYRWYREEKVKQVKAHTSTEDGDADGWAIWTMAYAHTDSNTHSGISAAASRLLTSTGKQTTQRERGEDRERNNECEKAEGEAKETNKGWFWGQE